MTNKKNSKVKEIKEVRGPFWAGLKARLLYRRYYLVKVE